MNRKALPLVQTDLDDAIAHLATARWLIAQARKKAKAAKRPRCSESSSLTEEYRGSGTSRPILYLAAPYSHADFAVVEARFAAVNRAAAKLVAQGCVVFSPISMTHPIALCGAPGNHLDPSWYGFDEPFMDASSECVVLTLDGWRESRGVTAEIAYFTAQGKPVRYMEPIA